ncbi:uncharacterized protein VTP21DRAFT_6236 [Calcarisporiella thermophila]|uniref:uncharacterized protein n=1 Tax=Calcarisporiella thermophila TaxID=911321 RepID=UPI0037424F48
MTVQSLAKLTLNCGRSMPVLGLGTYRMKDPQQIKSVVRAAIESGYRLIDSATGYGNEASIGEVLRELFADPALNLKREDVFIASKLAPKDQGYDACTRAVEKSLQNFGVEYIDLYYIHWPGTQGLKPEDPRNAENRRESWRALEQLYKQGKLRAIGVSNYTVEHLNQLLSHCEIPPAACQFEIHPLYHDLPLINLCRERGIQVQAYSSLGEGHLVREDGIVLPQIYKIAAWHEKTPAQILLRWAVQHGYGIIPKSTSEERVRENADVFGFQLTEDEMEVIDSLSAKYPRKFCWDPIKVL